MENHEVMILGSSSMTKFKACEGRQNDDELDKEDMEEKDDDYIASEEEDDNDDDSYFDDSGVDECVDLSVTFPPETFCLVTNNVDAKSLVTPTTAADFQDEHYEDSDDLHTPPESEDEELGKNYPIFKMGDGNARVKFEMGLKFNNKKQAKDAIEEYALQTRKNLKLKKNEKEYLVVKCMPDCPRDLPTVKCTKCEKMGHNRRTCGGKRAADRALPKGGNKKQKKGKKSDTQGANCASGSGASDFGAQGGDGAAIVLTQGSQHPPPTQDSRG